LINTVRLTLSISPCPNDTFMFDALINGRIDTQGLEFDVAFADIEQLNAAVLSPSDNSPHISKISYAVLPAIADRYRLLDSGSALGHGNGPLLVARESFRLPPLVGQTDSAPTDGVARDGLRLHPPVGLTEGVPSGEWTNGPLGGLTNGQTEPEMRKMRVAIPGVHTTANMLLQRLFPQLTDRRPMLFSEIAPAVADGRFDAGVLIHEGRFTYRDHGLGLVADLGVEWGRATGGLPLPLGAIVASRALPAEVVRTVEELIRRSVEYAFAHPTTSREFVKAHAREMDDAVIDSHIALFVNRNSLSLDPAARRAVRELTGINVG